MPARQKRKKKPVQNKQRKRSFKDYAKPARKRGGRMSVDQAVGEIRDTWPSNDDSRKREGFSVIMSRSV
jgi:hypothetical protein